MANQKNIIEKLLQASQKVHQASLRGSGNYIVVNSNTASILITASWRMAKIKRIFNL